HHDDGRVDDDAEVDCAERQQIGVFALHDQDDDRKEQCKGNVDADDDGAAQLTQEDPLDKEHQKTAEDQVVQHRVRGDAHQRAAVVEGNDLDTRRKAAVGIEFLNRGLHLRDDGVGVLGPPHHYDCGDHVIVVIPAGDTEPWYVTDRDLGDILDPEG